MQIPLRNQFAHWVSEAVDSAERALPLRALVAFCHQCDDRGIAPRVHSGDEPVAAATDFFTTRPNEVELREEWTPDLEALRERCQRADRFLRAPNLEAIRAIEEPTRKAVAAAVLLFNVGLYFEVHEALEPPWLRSSGRDRVFLQGLIQTAVAFHHAETGNPNGAHRLLRDGATKLATRLPETHGLELTPFVDALADLLEVDPATISQRAPTLTMR